ncbi:Reverse transcriptase ribonuclease h [Mycena sanguinolenta]|uniref:Reverse transcriptase ribonuclease h n=1 Tax=Mycena sanguinolenta TaxID=230812 RepID=A0A8H6Y9Z9_9AGAR|nr:Reverse transcriptase ribonuclease h [Mycena sanguinolenta]
MLAYIFSNQGWGSLVGSLVTIVVPAAYKHVMNDEGKTSKVDGVWRIVVGVSLIPAFGTLYQGFTLPESDHFKESQGQAQKVNEIRLQHDGNWAAEAATEKAGQHDVYVVEVIHKEAHFQEFLHYFSEWRHMKLLIGTSMCWFYGINLNQNVVLEQIGFDGKTDTPWEKLFKVSTGNIIITALGFVHGYWATVLLIEKLGRKWIQIQGFLLAALFLAILAVKFTSLSKPAFIVCFSLLQFFFNFGANTAILRKSSPPDSRHSPTGCPPPQAKPEAEEAAAEAAKSAEEERLEAEKKKPKLGAFDPNSAPPSFIESPISHFAQKKLERREYCPLWPFTPGGLKEAAEARLSSMDDISSLKLSRNDENQLTVQSGPASSSHKNMTRDEHLTWRQFSLGSNRYLKEIVRAGWPGTHVEALTQFFYALEQHDFRDLEDDGDNILKIYADRVRVEWFRTLGTPQAFNIAIIEEKNLSKIADEYFTKKRSKFISESSFTPSGIGIAIVIGPRWRAWRLLPGWESKHRKICWAEAVGFEFLVRTIIAAGRNIPPHITVYGDNTGVVEGWWKGRSANEEVNTVFRCIHTLSAEANVTFHTRYVPTDSNPADAGSRGEYGPTSLLLPPLPIPTELRTFIDNFDSPIETPRASARSKIPPSSHTILEPKLKQSKRRPMPYPSHLSLLPSSLRPVCFASERLYKWRPAVSRSDRHATSSIPEADLARTTTVLSHGWAEGTLETYGSGLLLFHCFCDSRHIPETARAPASPDLLAAFLAAIAGSYAGKTLENYFSGVRAWHVLHGIPWAPNKAEFDTLIRAAVALQPPSASKKKRQPYTEAIISTILSKLNLEDPLDASTAACLTAAFYSCARLGELTVKTLQSFDPSKHMKPRNVRSETDPQGRCMRVLAVPETKTSKGGEDLFFAAQPGPTNPEAALENHLRINEPPSDAHLFAYRFKNTHRPLSKTVFISRIHRAMKAAGLEPLQGHGIRIGATLFYLLRGTPFDVVKTIGRWSSDSFMLYLRKHAQIMAPYMQAQPELHAEFIRISMPPVRYSY